jgi:hypothetical protein
MVRKSVVLFAAVFTLTASAHAQLGVYGTVTVDRMSGLRNSPAATPGVVYNDAINPLGGTGGIFYDFLKLGPVRIGADLRGSITTTKRGAETASEGSGGRLDSGLGGVRVVFHTPIKLFKPYAEAAAGIGRSNYGIVLPTATSSGLRNNLEYHVFAGLDIKVLSVMDFRAVELGYGGLNSFGTDSHNYPLKSVSTGVVFHLPSF